MKYTWLICLLVGTFVSCSKLQDPLEREKEEMKAFFDDSKLLVPYKGVKIALRVDYTDSSADNRRISRTALTTLSAISNLVTKDSIPTGISGALEFYRQLSQLYELKKEINGINEDELPTIYEQFGRAERKILASDASTSIVKRVFGRYTNSTEHFLLGSIWFVLPGSPSEIYTYEAAQINENDIVKADQRILASLLKALVCEQNQWHYTSEQSSMAYINYLEAHKTEVIEATAYLDSVPGADPQKRFYELRSLGYALRGYARQNSGRDAESREDFGHFIDDVDQSAVANKELCFMAAYACIGNDQAAKAEKFLKRIEVMNTCNEDDRQAVVALRAYIANRDEGSFQKYIDTFSFTRIAFNYLCSVTQKSGMMEQLGSNSAMRELRAIPGRMNTVYHQSQSMLNTDSLVSGAGSLVKKFFR